MRLDTPEWVGAVFVLIYLDQCNLCMIVVSNPRGAETKEIKSDELTNKPVVFQESSLKKWMVILWSFLAIFNLERFPVVRDFYESLEGSFSYEFGYEYPNWTPNCLRPIKTDFKRPNPE